jgi:hypothetical protein
VLNIVRKVGDKVEAYKLTLARSEHRVEYLGEEPGNYLRQVNIIDPDYPAMQWMLPPKNIWRGGWKYFIHRLKTMDEHARKYRQIMQISLNQSNLEKTHGIMQRSIFGDLRESYINPDVGAICVGFVDSIGTSVSTKLNDGRDLSMLEYVDIP